MTEINKTLTILQSRWPEVTFIIGLHLSTLLMSRLLFSLVTKQVLGLDNFFLLQSAIGLLLWAFLILVHCGFLRTAYLEGDNRQSVPVLIRAGKHFFRRIFLWNLMYAIPFLVLMLLHNNLIIRYIRPDELIVTNAVFWIKPLCSAAIELALIKLSLLIPALIIVLDCEVIASFKLLRWCKLSNARELIVLFLVQIALGLLWTFASQFSIAATTLHYVTIGIYYIMSDFISLMIGVTAVSFVASLDVVCGEKAGLSSPVE
ncbi:MAG: hypothetical protein ACYSYV_06565 [Planctomycetota bacterium]|jgi:hypothetical protein